VSDARALYQAVIVDHDRAPRNHGPLAGADASATIDNPLCGDVVIIHLRHGEGAAGERTIAAVGFEARGCALCRAAASIMTERVRGLALAPARALAARFEEFVRLPDGTDVPAEVAAELGELAAFVGVRRHRSRQACALLPFRALVAALDAR
jgi:nitrogen fixation NifU-like protein